MKEKDAMRKDAQTIIDAVIRSALPDAAVARALEGKVFTGRVFLVAAGKAAWQMAQAAYAALDGRIEDGVVITKYGHAKGEIGALRIREAGHPIPDANSFAATQEALALTESLRETDTVLFLLSGGGSALFESPVISEEELQDITKQMLGCGADIVEMNTVRKRLSRVKGGRFASHCMPARLFSVVLSDILGDPLDMIASGPAVADASTCAQALAIREKYALRFSSEALRALEQETPKTLTNTETVITGSVRQLCKKAAEVCETLGYAPTVLTASMDCIAREAGRFLASVARFHAGTETPLAFIVGGETVVKLTGNGLGGRNQELALAAAEGIAGLESCAIFSVGSDGTDGPTDAAGGYVDGNTRQRLLAKNIRIAEVLEQNDAYHALQAVDGLIVTGPTGTNVNDFTVLLLG